MTSNSDTPSFAQFVRDAIEARMLSVNTAIPAKVLAYDRDNGTVDVRPLLKRKYSDGTVSELPKIFNVPIQWYRANNAYITLPIKVNDTVTLIFSQRSLDQWKQSGGTVDPKDPRKHALSDAIAVPGLYPKSTAPADPSPDNLEIVNNKAKVSLSPDGDVVANNDTATLSMLTNGTLKFTNENLTAEFKPNGDVELTNGNAVVSVKNDGEITIDNGGLEFVLLTTGKFTATNATGEFVASISQMIATIIAATTATALGPQPLLMPTMAADKAIFDSFKGP